MDDIKDRRDEYRMPINKVGISGLRYPIMVRDRQQGKQETVARISMFVRNPQHFDSTRMSRFIEVLNEHRGEVTTRTLFDILLELCQRLEAKVAHIKVEFPYFLERMAVVSEGHALIDYQCSFVSELNGDDEDFVLGVRVPVTNLCPCSKEISDYGIHKQRWYITTEVRSTSVENKEVNPICIEELVEIAERSALASVYTSIKHADKQHIIVHAPDNPIFVEDIVRNAATQLQRDFRIAWFRVHATSDESIHNNTTFALIEWERGSVFI